MVAKCTTWKKIGISSEMSRCGPKVMLQVSRAGARVGYIVTYEGRIVRHGIESTVKKAKALARRQAGSTGGLSGFALKDLWPFGKKPAKRHPMSHTVYMMKTKSGSYIPVDRPPTHAMAGARRKKRRR